MKQISETLLSSHWACGAGKHGHRLFHWCPACEDIHGVEVAPDAQPTWQWNGSETRPTFLPSLRHFVSRADGTEETTCHYFVKDGNIEFCGDCPHALAGTIVPLPPIPEEWRQ